MNNWLTKNKSELHGAIADFGKFVVSVLLISSMAAVSCVLIYLPFKIVFGLVFGFDETFGFCE